MSQPHPHLPENPNAGPAPWKSEPPKGCFSTASRFLVLVILSLMLVLPFTPFAGKIKAGLKDLVEAAQKGKTKVITREVTKEVPKEIIKEVIKEVPVPTPPPPLPGNFIPRKDVDVATLFNGITVKMKLQTEQGTYASLEVLDPKAYTAQFELSVRVPKPNQTVAELARLNKELPEILPDLDLMLQTGKVSGFYHQLYQNKTNAIERDITRLSRILDRHNFFDCETILELTHPTSKRRALLIQSEMDVVSDGSDGDRQPTLDDSVSLSDFYQPFTSYAWAKRTKTPNPLLARWEERLKKATENAAVKGLSADKKRDLKAIASQLEIEVKELKSRSSLIGEKDPFIVLSLLFRPYVATNKFAPQMGDYAVVIHGGKMYPAICGDYGPTMKMGEASLFMAKAINEKATPYRRPEDDLKVTYLIFPGTAEKPAAPPNLDHWHEQCAALLKEIGTTETEKHSLHKWEDPFKKPEPPAPDPAATVGGLAPVPATGQPPATATAPGAASGAGPTVPPAPQTQAQGTPATPGASPTAPVPASNPIPPNSAPPAAASTTPPSSPAPATSPNSAAAP